MFEPAKAQKIYIAVGYSDLRRGIDGFASIIQNTFHINPQTNALFIFCGRRSDRIKALYWDTDGYILLYKRLEGGRYAEAMLIAYSAKNKYCLPIKKLYGSQCDEELDDEETDDDTAAI